MQQIMENQARQEDMYLMRSLVVNDGDALRDLYDRYGGLVYHTAHNYVSNPAATEEIVQDVFTRIWQKASTYDAEIARVSTWLVNITRNRAIDELRRNKNRFEQDDMDIADMLDLSDHHNPGPEASADIHWQHECVRAAIAALPADQQQVLALAYYQDLSHSEIAETLHLPLGTVKTRLRLAMQKLRQLLSAEVTEDL